MHSSLITLRQTPQITPEKFLTSHPGCWIQYYDDTEAKDPTKACSARLFNPLTAERKQRDRCAVCYSLQAFGESRTKEGLLCFRNMGVDIDLVASRERRTIPMAKIDQRKDAYLKHHLLPFALHPHWLVETQHGFHIVYRVVPQRSAEGVQEAAALNRRLVAVLRGDANAALLTQVLRVPGTYQFKNPERAFLCRLLVNNANGIPPYQLDTIRTALDATEIFQKSERKAGAENSNRNAERTKHPPLWSDGLSGVPEGRRNATAAAIVGGILGRLPEYLWETAAWGGLKEWNQRNSVPLPERELRSVFQNIAGREHAQRQRETWKNGRNAPRSLGPDRGATRRTDEAGRQNRETRDQETTAPSSSPPVHYVKH